MLWFILVIPAAIFIVRDIWFGSLGPSDFIDGMACVFFTVFFVGIVVALCAGAAALTGLAFDSHAVLASEDQLVAIRDKDGIAGTFFLGSGVIKGDQYYFYYAKLPDGGFKPGKVYAGDGVRVYEDSPDGATLKTYQWVVDNPLVNWIAFPVNAGGWSYRFDVPKGTIRTGYTM